MNFEKITQIRESIKNCTNCSLSQTRTKSVPGKGSFTAEIMFVGEAPGRSEDKAGEPFVGIAGKILDKALQEAGISRSDVYITNVVKCRPPNNRVPNINEKKSCEDFLIQEIQIIKPRIICILGNTAYSSLLGGGSISNNRGSLIKKDNLLYFLTFHPAAVIYNRSLEDVLQRDIKKLLDIVADLKNGREPEFIDEKTE